MILFEVNYQLYPSIVAFGAINSDQLFSFLDILQASTASPCNESDDMQEFSWNLDTKYYTASITLTASKNRIVPSWAFSEAVEGVIVYFDPKNRSSFAEAKL